MRDWMVWFLASFGAASGAMTTHDMVFPGRTDFQELLAVFPEEPSRGPREGTSTSAAEIVAAYTYSGDSCSAHRPRATFHFGAFMGLVLLVVVAYHCAQHVQRLQAQIERSKRSLVVEYEKRVRAWEVVDRITVDVVGLRDDLVGDIEDVNDLVGDAHATTRHETDSADVASVCEAIRRAYATREGRRRARRLRSPFNGPRARRCDGRERDHECHTCE